MIINLFNEYNKEITFDFEKIIKDFEKYESDNEVSLILVDTLKIHEMNKMYRNIDRPTDVLSFESDDEEDDNYLGEIFICIDKVYSQAEEYGHSINREFAFLLVHGILHLHGYDHMTKEDEIIMFKKQEEILNKFNYMR